MKKIKYLILNHVNDYSPAIMDGNGGSRIKEPMDVFPGHLEQLPETSLYKERCPKSPVLLNTTNQLDRDITNE